ncbi:hypothetical protein [uncultured Chryseobacterium sp.]|uniref:hypothetical protein n=1 Tax=uncultured Chryseobacterium sp. TaxID=259322 RepID=UPI0025FA766D|nr:hypothetical protein [uncultured Chryseobacterium sp.]
MRIIVNYTELTNEFFEDMRNMKGGFVLDIVDVPDGKITKTARKVMKKISPKFTIPDWSTLQKKA